MDCDQHQKMCSGDDGTVGDQSHVIDHWKTILYSNGRSPTTGSMAESQKLLAVIGATIVRGPTVAMISIAARSGMVSAVASVNTSVMFKNDRRLRARYDNRCSFDNNRWFNEDRRLLSHDRCRSRSVDGALLHFVDYHFADAVLVQVDNFGDTNFLLHAASPNLVDDQLRGDATVRHRNRVFDGDRFL